ncbi:hypothetical protein [Mesorhizobium sp. M2A.F.Ca.ET.039.01.1.1]|uniref:hypothetical protein n=1 Tax=Mesorhizobium sp. M2A.F.Ca.ET.039.01.1.1 TaxID=2496746 RepID=UPI000FCC2E7C|nr:hypothetical protein [Mesorhizobium sp. M2A.F.Ca.ET.039.01.1.1]RWX72530.1 hypothetical protein EOA24_00625 [Mesorhizobium sp. M2A.F.Ca.ET.039.01.1.1]
MTQNDLAENERARIGGNNPPMTLAERLPLDYEALTERVAAILTKARDELPSEITTDDENSKLGEIIKGIRDVARDAEADRKKEKDPHLEAGRTIDAFFAALTDRLNKGKEVLERRGKKYLDAKAQAERERREEAARIAREEAERKLREAEAAEEAGKDFHTELALEQAAQAETRADLAQQASEEKAADLARTRMAGGGVSTLKTEWTFEIKNREQIPFDRIAHFISDAELTKAVRAFVKGGGRSLPGVRIYEDTKAQYR